MRESDIEFEEMAALPVDRDNKRVHQYNPMPTGDDRYEKPWQRVPSPVLLVTIGFYFLFAYLAQLIEDDMPSVVLDSDIPNDVSNKFSEEAALRYLDELLGNQARVAGTRYHLEKTKDLKFLVDSVVMDSTIPVRTNWQLASGDFYLTLIGAPHVSRYVNASNIIAVLEGESGFYSNGSIGSSLLINCHYDSVPYAMGASDNGLFCAVMIEILSRLSKRQTKLQHNVIFLFNGAEENPLMGSHAFLQHEWSKNCFAVINLDATGMNGKPALFQVTDPRLSSIFAKVVSRPNAQGFGEFLFSSGVIPSDTDFRIFRDFGNIYGIDIAFVKWGVVYHTPYDNPSMILPGVAQCAGEMLLNLIIAAADQTGLEKLDPQTTVYFDYLNWFVVTYSVTAAIAVDLICSIAGFAGVAYYLWIVGFSKSSVTEMLWSCLGRVASIAGGAVVAVIYTAVMVATTIQLRYLSYPWIVVGTTWVPFLVGAIGVSHLFDKWRCAKVTIPRSLRVYQWAAASRFLLSLVLFVTSLVPSLVSVRYLFSAVVLMMSIAAVVSMTVYRVFRMQAWQHLLLDNCLSLPLMLFVFSLALRLNALMMPILGRSGTNSPDYTVALLNIGFSVLVILCISGMELLFTRKHLGYVLGFLAILAAIVTFYPLFPYQDDGPATQRHYWFHAETVTYDINGIEQNRSSGLIITKHDVYTLDYVLPALEDHNITYKYRYGFAGDCERYVHCNQPLYRARFDNALKNSLMLYTGSPAPFDPPPSLKMTNKLCNGDVCTMDFEMIGTAHNLLSLSPRAGTNLTSWSYTSPVTPAFVHRGLAVYLIVHSEATYTDGIVADRFTLQIKVPINQQSQPIIDIAHHAHKIYHPEDYTEEYKRILNAMPKYFSIASHLSIRSNYIF